MGDKYLRTILAFFGIQDIDTIAIENLDIMGADVEGKVKEGIEKATNAAKRF